MQLVLTLQTKKHLIDTYGLLDYEDLIEKTSRDNISINEKYEILLNDDEIELSSSGLDCEIQTKFSYLNTSGDGYVDDLSHILSIFEKKSKDDVLIFINADLPLIQSDMIDEVIGFYLAQDKPALSTVVPVEIFEEYNIDYEYEFEGNVPSGLNILVVQDEVILQVPKVEFAFNINTVETADEFNKFLNK